MRNIHNILHFFHCLPEQNKESDLTFLCLFFLVWRGSCAIQPLDCKCVTLKQMTAFKEGQSSSLQKGGQHRSGKNLHFIVWPAGGARVKLLKITD